MTGVDLWWNWHIDVICRHCDALYDSSILKLTVSIPPRSLKSTIFSQYFPVWLWLKDASLAVLNASYNADLANRDAQVSKTIIESEWFKQIFGDLITLSKLDRDGYVTDRGGRRQAIGVQGKATGYGGDVIIIDDYISVNDSNSKVMRDNGLLWFKETMTSRANNPKTARWVVIAQRTHVEDLTGWLMSEPEMHDWEHLVLPVQYDGVRRKTSLGYYDIRTQQGEILHPERMGEKEIASYKASLGLYGFNSQYMQSPFIRGGNFFKSENFKKVDEVTDCVHSAIFVDTAVKAGEDSDYTAFALCGFTRNGGFHIFEIRRGKWTFELNVMQEEVIRFGLECKNRSGIGMFEGIFVEPAMNGLSFIQSIKLKCMNNGIIVKPLKPARTESKSVLKDKGTRAQDFSPLVETQRVTISRGAWNKDFLDEVEAFTLNDTHKHDDQIDAVMRGYEHYALNLRLAYKEKLLF